MGHLQKKALLAAGLFSLFFVFAANALAVGESLCPSGYGNLCSLGPDGSGNVPIVSQIVQILLTVAVLASVIFLIYGGIKWILSGGDKAKVEAARSHITGAIIGLVIAFMAFGIVNIVMFILTGKSDLNFNLPVLNGSSAGTSTSPGGGCFLAGTKITLTNNRYKAIQDLKPGDKVLSFNLDTKQIVEETVGELIIHKKNSDGYLLINNKLKVTPNHPMYNLGEKKWVRADALKIGDQLLNNQAEKVVIMSILKKEGTNTVYNLHINGKNHNYFADGFLVHNK